MYNKEYHDFIENKYSMENEELINVGEYNYKYDFFSLKKKAKMKLPINMHSEGLLILGSPQSYRREFSINYAKELIKRGFKVLYITDALTKNNCKITFETESLKKHLGFDKISNKLINIEELSGKFNEEAFSNGALLSVIYSKNDEVEKNYEQKLLNLLNELNESKISLDNCEKGHPKLIVVIDEDLSDKGLDKKSFKKNINNLKSNNFNFVICGYDGKRYRNLLDNINHYILFESLDPQGCLMGNDFFKRKAYLIDSIKFVGRMSFRDFRNLKPNEYYYTQRDYFGWSNVVSFDIDKKSKKY